MSRRLQGDIHPGLVAGAPMRPAPSRRRAWLPASVKSLGFWIEFVCFFLIATPFELAIGSGYGYAIKAFACGVLLVPRLASGRASTDSRFAWIAIFAMLFLAANFLEPTIRAIFAFLLVLLGASLGMMKSEEWNRRMLDLVTVYILVHLAGFVFAFMQFVLQGDVLDLHGMVFPSASRAQAIGASARLSGFHNEPGTYAQWLLMATFLRCLLTRRIASLLTVATGASMVMTFSLWAIVGAALLALAIALEMLLRARIGRKIRFLISATLLSLAALTAIAYLPGGMLEDGLAYLQLKAEMGTESGQSKLMAMAELRERLPELIFLGAPVEPGFCPYCQSPQDVGIWANGIYYFGLVPSLLIFISLTVMIIRKWGYHYIPFLIAMLLWKAVFYDPFLWIIIGYAIRNHNKNHIAKDRVR